MAMHSAKVRRIAIQTGQPSVTAEDGDHMPAKPIIEPTDRSNSPAIISMQAPTAMIMNCARDGGPVQMPLRVEHAAVAGEDAKKKTNTAMVPTMATQFRTDQRLAKSRCCLDAFVAFSVRDALRTVVPASGHGYD
jgi:hypothetical protein